MKRSTYLGIGLTLVSLILGFWLGVGQNRRQPTANPAAQGANQAKDTGSQLPDADLADSSPAGLIARMFNRLRSGGMSPGELNAFRKAMLEAPPDQALRALVRFLGTGQDARTSETFSIGSGGVLAGAPTFRVLLLDLLGRIGRDAGATETAAISKSVLATKSSADEWALALRNLAWSTPEDHTVLAEKARELLHYQPWRQNPSAGYFESFDVIPYLRDAGFVTDLAEMTRSEDPAVKGASGMALDRLAQMAPLQVMNFLNNNRDELADKPFLRADYFAKADLTQTEQRQALEYYFARPDVTEKEKAKTLSEFATPGVFAADSLLTTPPPADIPVETTQALRKTIADWLQTQRFPTLRLPMLQLQAQLAAQSSL